MDKAKNMKMTPIGLFPQEWNVVALKNVTNVVTGATPSTEVKEYWGGHIPWMSSGELNMKFVHSVVGRITQEGYDNCGTHMIPEHCVLIGLAGQGKTRGTAAYNTIPLCTNQSIGSILPSTSFNPLYLYYWIDSQYNFLRLLSAGDGGRGGLNKQLLLNLLVPFPALSEQNKIADALFSTDSLIISLDKAIAKKRQIKEGLMQQLLTGKTRLPGFSGKWKGSTLGQLVDICKGVQFDSDLFSENGRYPMLNGGITPSGYSEFFNAEADTITISEGGNSCGYVNYMTEKFWCGGHCYSLKVKSVDKLFLYQLLKFNEKDIMALRVGSGLPNVQSKSLIDFRLYFSEDEREQKSISNILKKTDDEIASLESQRDKYTLIKQGMMQELLTGKTRLI